MRSRAERIRRLRRLRDLAAGKTDDAVLAASRYRELLSEYGIPEEELGSREAFPVVLGRGEAPETPFLSIVLAAAGIGVGWLEGGPAIVMQSKEEAVRWAGWYRRLQARFRDQFTYARADPYGTGYRIEVYFGFSEPRQTRLEERSRASYYYGLAQGFAALLTNMPGAPGALVRRVADAPVRDRKLECYESRTRVDDPSAIERGRKDAYKLSDLLPWKPGPRVKTGRELLIERLFAEVTRR